jgi:hypothetical protein
VRADEKLIAFLELQTHLGTSQRLGCSIARDASPFRPSIDTRGRRREWLREWRVSV